MSTQQASQTEKRSNGVPIKRVVIYKNGVAYFEREGTVEDDATLTLTFKPSEMNDILRSLRVVDLNGGKIANISYSGANAVSIPVGLPNPDYLSMVPSGVGSFRFLVGSNVKITLFDGNSHVGRVLGQITRQTERPHEALELFVNNSEIITVPSHDVKGIQITDAHVNANVREWLDTQLTEKKKDLKQVTIKCKGKGTRVVRVSYILENPIWKSNYRIYMKGGEKKEFFLEGWACVDNTSEDDWSEVSLSLVSGSPISFQHDVYNPIIGIRPGKFTDDGKNAHQIQQVQHVAQGNRGINAMQQFAGFNAAQQAPVSFQQMNYAQPQSAYNARMMNYDTPSDRGFGFEGFDTALDVESQTVEIGNLFHYEVQTPISVESKHSSLVPTVSGVFHGKKVCWFSPARHSVNPLSSVLLRNSLGTILDKGPIIVAEDENYLGESLLENTLLQDEEKLIPYSVNLECKISFTTTKENTPKHLKIKGGLLYITITKLHTTKYVLCNNSEHEIDLALDHGEAISDKVEGPYTTVRMKDTTRFCVLLPPMKKTLLNVPLASEFLSTPNAPLLSHSKFDFAQFYIQGNLSEAGFRSLSELCDLAENVNQLRTQLVEEKAVEEQIIADQKRVQALLASVRADTTLAFERQITALEAQLAASRDAYSTNHDAWKRARTDVVEKINALNHQASLEGYKPPAEHLEEVQSQVGTYSKTLLQELLSESGIVNVLAPRATKRITESVSGLNTNAAPFSQQQAAASFYPPLEQTGGVFNSPPAPFVVSQQLPPFVSNFAPPLGFPVQPVLGPFSTLQPPRPTTLQGAPPPFASASPSLFGQQASLSSSTPLDTSVSSLASSDNAEDVFNLRE